MFLPFVLCIHVILDIQALAERIEYMTDRNHPCISGFGISKCSQQMNLQKGGQGRDFYDLSDSVDESSRKKAWKVLSGRGYRGAAGQNVYLSITAKNKQIFRMHSFSLQVKNSIGVDMAIFLELSEQPHQIYGDTLRINRSDFVKLKLPRANATMLSFTFYADKESSQSITVRKLTLKACKQEAEIKVARINRPIRSIGRSSASCQTMIHSPQDPDFFTVMDNDPDRDERLLFNLTENPEPYIGAINQDVQFTFAANDTGDFEWWNVCLKVTNACAVEFNLHAHGITYKQTHTPCNSSLLTNVCVDPLGKDITVTKGTIRIHACENSTVGIEARELKIAGCRDHWANQYTVHTNPGDNRILTINTVRNETITKFVQKTCGQMTKSTMVQYSTQHTDGNFTFFIGEDSLVSKIMTDKDIIKFHWILDKPAVVISVLSDNGRYQADTRVQLSDKVLLELVPFVGRGKTRRKKRQVCKRNNQVNLNVFVKQCDTFVGDALVFARVLPLGHNTSLTVYGSPSRHAGMYTVSLPTEATSGITKTQLCHNFIQVQQSECRKYSIITRARYFLICRELLNLLLDFTDVNSDDPVMSRIKFACKRTFKAMNAICRSVEESPKPGLPTHFEEACDSGVRFIEEDLFHQLTNTVQVSFFARNPNAKIVAGNKKTLILNQRKFFSTTISMNEISVDVFPIPFTPSVHDGYQISIHYNCGAKDSDIRMALVSSALGRQKFFQTCSGVETDVCSCCDYVVEGTAEIFRINKDSAFMDHLEINYLRKGMRVFQRRYFVQVQSINETV